MLDWMEHIREIYTKIPRAIGFMKHSRSFLPEETLRTMHIGIVEPHFVTVVLSEVSVVQLKLTSCKKCRAMLPVL